MELRLLYKRAIILYCLVACGSLVAEERASKKTYMRAGVMAMNTFYADKTITPGLFSGFYRPFAKFSYDEKLEIMARGNLTVKQYLKEISGIKQTNVVGALEIFSAELKFGNQKVLIGRSFFLLEQGVLFANFADGVSYTGRFRFGTLKTHALASGEYGSSACALNVTGCNGDPSPFVSTPTLAADSGVQNSGRRIFAAVEYTTPEKFGTEAMAYGLYTKDLIQESASTGTRYEYNPYYAGLGLKGYIVNSNYRYRVDGIYQGGTTYNVVSYGSSQQATIQAFAILANAAWSLPVLKVIEPQLTGEFAMGSGDADSTRMTTAGQSNTSGNYNAFQSFGSYSGGLGLKPRLTNLQVYRVGTYVRPFKKWYALKDIGLQLKYSLYRKTVTAGGTSDPSATENDSDVGMAGDLALVSNLTSDVQFFYGFGIFKPGAAYVATNTDGSDGRALRYAHLITLTLIF